MPDQSSPRSTVIQPSPPDAPLTPKPTFGPAFWFLNSIEMFERLAYFGVRTVVGVYIMQADDPGGLHLTAWHKAQIFGWWFIFQSILPMFTGGFADRYGYKRTLAFAISMNMLGYVLMAFMRDYWSFFAAVMVLATGTAFFKPSIQGSLAQNLAKGNSSLGWGIFYWVVNIGGLIAPFVNVILLAGGHTQAKWQMLFFASAGFCGVMLLLLLTFKDVPSGANKTDSVLAVFRKTIVNIFEPRLICWLLIMSGFWLMMYQLWDLHPNFIVDWVDSTMVARSLTWLPDGVLSKLTETTPRGVMVPQQMLLNINAAFIVVFIIFVSWLVRRMRTLSAMLIGMTVATAGILVAGLTYNGWVLALGIVFFSIGEMLTGPKKNEYLGLIAPPGKKGLYLGYVNIPVGIGGYVGSQMAGYLYGHFGEKAVLALKYLAQKTTYGMSRGWDGQVSSLEKAMDVPRTQAFAKLMEVTNLDASAATKLLWETYDPQYVVWIPFAAVGVISAIALYIFGRMAKRWKDMNA